MKRSSKIVTVSVVVSVGLAVVYLAGYQICKSANPSTDTEQATLAISDALALAQTTEPQSSVEEPSPQLAALDQGDVDPASIDWAAMRARSPAGDLYDPMLLRWNQLAYTPEEIAAFNKLAVLPFNPKVGEECGLREFFAGRPGSFVAENCLPVFERPSHPYQDLSVEELVDLAETDPEAAVFASRKLNDDAQSVDFALRATALSGKTGPILEVANRYFDADVAPTEPDQLSAYADEVISRIILERVAHVLGDPRANPKSFEERIKNFAKTPEQERRANRVISEKTREVLNEIIEIERSTTGSTTVWEKVNA